MDERFEWTVTTLEVAVSMWNDGKGAAEIADTLGTTRNSVIGKMHRTAKVRDVKRHVNPVLSKKKVPEPPPVIEPAIEPVIEQSEEEDDDAEAKTTSSIDDIPWHPIPAIEQQIQADGVSFFDVKSCQCRWPLWGDSARLSIEDKRFCGKRTETVSSSWCLEHAARMFQPVRR